ncbi:CHAT domain-containing protein [Scytonema tolypothrichoides VB-61278]|nr:CHAT domain-containing protein [Scytonema tolypothrichoides VB-61278]
MKTQKILILASTPHGLRLDKEIREIEEAIRRAANRDLFEIRIKTAVRPQDIRRAIAEEQPQIVHFCGHGLEDGSLLLEDEGGNNQPISPKGLASLFKLHNNYVNCVLLNACHSEKTAIEISQYINYVIGMNQPIDDKAAIEFAIGFYDGLGYKTSDVQDLFQRAFNEGIVAIEMASSLQSKIPVLKEKIVKNIPFISEKKYSASEKFYTIVTGGNLPSDWRISMEGNSAALGTRAIVNWTQRVEKNSQFKLIDKGTNDTYEIHSRVEINGNTCLTTYPDGVLKLNKCDDTAYQTFVIDCKKEDSTGNLSECYIVNKATGNPIGTDWETSDPSKPITENYSFIPDSSRWWSFVVVTSE